MSYRFVGPSNFYRLDLAVFVQRIEGPDWPKDVLVEDLSFPAHHVLDRLLEVAPSRVVLVVVKSRPFDRPGTIRRSVLDLVRTDVDEVLGRIPGPAQPIGATGHSATAAPSPPAAVS